MSTETWKRKARAAKRRATMNSTPIKTTPIKTTRTRSLTGAHQTAVTRPTSTPILLTNNEMNVPSVNRNANVATTLTQNKAKPQSPKPPAARIHESPKRAGTGREEMIKSIQLTMKPQKNLTETNGNGDNDDADAWE